MTRQFGKKLVLNREMIRELTNAQLQDVVGAGEPILLTRVQGCGGGHGSSSIQGHTCLCSGGGPTCAQGCCA